MIKGILCFVLIQLMFLITCLFGGIKYGTNEAGWVCFASMCVGVFVFCYVYSVEIDNKKYLDKKKPQ